MSMQALVEVQTDHAVPMRRWRWLGRMLCWWYCFRYLRHMSPCWRPLYSSEVEALTAERDGSILVVSFSSAVSDASTCHLQILDGGGGHLLLGEWVNPHTVALADSPIRRFRIRYSLPDGLEPEEIVVHMRTPNPRNRSVLWTSSSAPVIQVNEGI